MIQVRQLTKDGTKISRSMTKWPVTLVYGHSPDQAETLLLGTSDTVEGAERAVRQYDPSLEIVSSEFKADWKDASRIGCYFVYVRQTEVKEQTG